MLQFHDPKNSWKQGIDFEIDFWNDWINTKGSKWPEEYSERLNDQTLIGKDLVSCLPQDQTELHILDVGSGPVSNVGRVVPDGRKATVVAVDPLADAYNLLWDKAGIIPPLRTQMAEVERLDEKFAEASFDVVNMCNALDHCYNPLQGIYQMLHVVKSDCYVLLTHSSNEAEKANYVGFHQWNLSTSETGDFIIWNKSATLNINEILKEIATTEVLISNEQSIVVRIKKTPAPTPTTYLEPNTDSTID